MDFTKYQNTMPYPAKPRKKDYLDCETYETDYNLYIEKIREYRTNSRNLEHQFMVDAFEELGISDNPKKNKLFGLAYDYGHSAGIQEVWNFMIDLAELIK